MKEKIENFRASINQKKLLQLRIMTAALSLGPLLFMAVATFVNLSSSASKEAPEILSFINIALMVIAIIISSLLPGIIMRSKARILVEGNDFERIFFKVQSAHIFRLALLEGAALFGGVTLIIGAPLWNAVSIVPLLLCGFKTFPHLKGLTRVFIVYFLQDERLLIEYS